MDLWMRQTQRLFALNLRDALHRPLSPAIITIGFFAVVLVLIAVLSIGTGLGRAFGHANATDVALVLSNGAFTETSSHLTDAAIRALASQPGVATGPAGPLISPEALASVIVAKRGSGIDSNLVFRGVTDTAFNVHGKIRIVAGRRFKDGVNEVIVGRQATREYQNLQIGDTLKAGGSDWKIVGIFTADGNPRESEIWTDAHQLQNALHLGDNYSDAWVKLTSPAALTMFTSAAGKEPQLNVEIKTEKAYFSDIGQRMTTIVSVVGTSVGILMAIGAIIGAINLFYTGLAARLGEIATVRAIGFGGSAALAATLLEALLFALIGGVIGAGIAFAVFNGYQAGTLSGSGSQQVAFQFAVTPALLAGGVIFALIMGLIGGIFPAIRTARLPIVTALREA